MTALTVALLQLRSPGPDPARALEVGERACREAAALGADLALFPEGWQAGYAWTADGPTSAAALAIEPDDPFLQRFRDLARELDLAIAVTYLQRWPGAPRNAATIFDRHGRAALTYAKVHTCDFGQEADLTPGDRLPTAELDTAARQRARRPDDLLRPRVPRSGARAHARRRRGAADAERVPAAGRPRLAVPRSRLREHGRRRDGQLRGGARRRSRRPRRVRRPLRRVQRHRLRRRRPAARPYAGRGRARRADRARSLRPRRPARRTAPARSGATRTAGPAPTPRSWRTGRRARSSSGPTRAGPSSGRPRPARRAARRSAAAPGPAAAGASTSTCRRSGSAS